MCPPILRELNSELKWKFSGVPNGLEKTSVTIDTFYHAQKFTFSIVLTNKNRVDIFTPPPSEKR